MLKKALLILLLSILCGSTAVAQELNLSYLQALMAQEGWATADNILKAQGWSFVRQTQPNLKGAYDISWRAELELGPKPPPNGPIEYTTAWVTLSMDNSMPEKVKYELFNSKYYQKFLEDSNLDALGYRRISREYHVGGSQEIYRSMDFRLSIVVKRMDKSDEGLAGYAIDPYDTYTITLSRSALVGVPTDSVATDSPPKKVEKEDPNSKPKGIDYTKILE